MPATISYQDKVIATVAPGESKFLECYGKKMLSNVVVELPEGYVIPEGTVSITENGTHDVTESATVVVDVPVPDGYIQPSGTLTITENGTHDVTESATVKVDVQPTLQEKTVTVTENGTIEIAPDDGYAGLSKIILTVTVATE